MRANGADKRTGLLAGWLLPVAHISFFFSFFLSETRSCRLCYRAKNNDIATPGATERMVA